MKKLKTIYGDTILVDDDNYEIAKQYNWSVKVDNKTQRREVITYSKIKDINNKEVSKEIVPKKVLQKGITYKRLILDLGTKVALFKNENPFDLRKENLIVFNTPKEFTNVLSKLHKLSKKGNLKLSNKIPKKPRVAGGKKPNPIQTKYLGIQCIFPDIPHPWVCTIRCDHKIYRLGSYSKEEYAALAYDQKALELYGKDAIVNFPGLTMEEITEKLEKIKAEDAVIFDGYRSKSLQGINFNVPKTSQYVGVHFSKAGKKWVTILNHRKREYYLGYHDTEEEAALVYDKKALELYGEKAKVNFPHKRRSLLREIEMERLENPKEEERERRFQKRRSIYNQGKLRDVKKTSKYVGVCLYKGSNRWRVKISHRRVLYHLGYFANEEEAARAYDKKALELYGKDAKLNFPKK